MKKKMYTNKPLVEAVSTVMPTENLETDKRVKFLEDRVRQLTEQVNRMASALALNSRQLKRTNTDVHNITTVVRQKY